MTWSELSEDSKSSLHLYAGESTLQATTGLNRVAVGDPSVADVTVLEEDAFLLVGVGPGHTTLMVWDDLGFRVKDIVVTARPLLDLVQVERLVEAWGVNLSWWKEYLVVQGTVASSSEKEVVNNVLGSLWEPIIDLVVVAGEEDTHDNDELRPSGSEIQREIEAILGVPDIQVEVVKDLVILQGEVELATHQILAGEVARQFASDVLNLIQVATVTLAKQDEIEKETAVKNGDSANVSPDTGANLPVSAVDLNPLKRILQDLPMLEGVTVSQKGNHLVIEGCALDDKSIELAEAIVHDYGLASGLEVFSLLRTSTPTPAKPFATLIQSQIGIPGLVVRWVGDSLVLQGSLSPRERAAALRLAEQYGYAVVDLTEEVGLSPLVLADVKTLIGPNDDISVTAVGNNIVLRGEVISTERKQAVVAMASAFGYPVIDATTVAFSVENEQPLFIDAAKIGQAINLDTISVQVLNGVVLLEGTVDNALDKIKAEAIARTFTERVVDLVEVEEKQAPVVDNWEPLVREAAGLGARLYRVGTSVVLEGKVPLDVGNYLQSLLDGEFPGWINRLTILDAPLPPSPDMGKLELLLGNLDVQYQCVADTIILEGTVASESERERAEGLASALGMPVHNFLVVDDRIRQVWVDVYMLETSSSDGGEIGLDWHFNLASDDSGSEEWVMPLSTLGSLHPNGEEPNPSYSLIAGPLWAKAYLHSLVRSGKARILASPSLLAEDGEWAEFLAGGEIPIPADAGIEWKSYGVSLKVKPTLLGDGHVHLLVEPEVSSLDWENATQLQDAVIIPGLRTRRWRTQAAIEPGKALVIGGLLSEEESTRSKQVPVLGDLPILGSLFRSEVRSRQKNDLIVIVSPRLVGEDDFWKDTWSRQ